MGKLEQLISEFKGLNTNDPSSQRRIVAVLEQLLVVLKQEKVAPRH